MIFELDSFFDGRQASSLETQSIFVNRSREVELFRESLGAGNSTSPPGSTAERDNVLCFHGIGGIGKSALSSHLEKVLSERPAEDGEAHLWGRANFEESELLDFESLMLSMRAQLGLQVSRWPAFDIAFQVYWNLKYPGMSLQEFTASSSKARGILGKVDLGNQIRSTCETVLFGGLPILNGMTKLGETVLTAVRRRLKSHHLFAEFPAFSSFLALESASEMLPFLPAFLNYDISSNRRVSQVGPGGVYFFDNFETVQNASSDVGSPEDLIARLCYLMPRVLFVITSRNALMWATNRPSLKYSGPRYWPKLIGGAADSHEMEVKPLSDEHCLFLLQNCLTRDGKPAISDSVAHSILSRSDGLPLFLDLCVEYFHSLDSQGIDPNPAEFNRTFPQIVLRLMRDLANSERELLRTAAVLGEFDKELLREVQPGVSDTALDRFLLRQFIRRSETAWLPFSIHSLLRDCVTNHDDEIQGWSDRERRLHVDRCIAALAKVG